MDDDAVVADNVHCVDIHATAAVVGVASAAADDDDDGDERLPRTRPARRSATNKSRLVVVVRAGWIILLFYETGSTAAAPNKMDAIHSTTAAKIALWSNNNNFACGFLLAGDAILKNARPRAAGANSY